MEAFWGESPQIKLTLFHLGHPNTCWKSYWWMPLDFISEDINVIDLLIALLASENGLGLKSLHVP